MEWQFRRRIGLKRWMLTLAALLINLYMLTGSIEAQEITLSECRIIDSPGYYFLTGDIAISTEVRCISITSDNVYLDGKGYKIGGSYMKWSSGIYIYSSSTVENVTVTNLTLTGWYYGIYIENANRSRIEFNTITDNGPYGIYLVNSSFIAISHNTILDNGVGVCLNQNSRFSQIQGNFMENNLDAVYILSSDENVISNNTMVGNWGALWIHNSAGNVVSNNTIENGGDVLWISSSSSNEIAGNVIRGNDEGIWIFNHSIYNTIAGNIIVNNGYGIKLSDYANSNLIYNNLFNNTVNANVTEGSFNIWNVSPKMESNVIGGATTGGNYWAKPDGNGISQICSDTDSDGICDSPHVLNNNNIDYLPLSASQPLQETIPDNVDDDLEKLVTKYYPDFDWKTQTPLKQDVLQAVISAVIQYFSATDDAAKQGILNDVVQLVGFYFTLPS